MSQQAMATRPSKVVDTQYGQVRGSEVRGVRIFRGIPYGGPTEGTGRFLPPTRPASWVRVHDGTITGPRCIQAPENLFHHPLIGEYFAGGRADRVELSAQVDSENCLNLNVLTPGVQGKRPVLVYIHGGGFASGSSILTLFSDGFVREQDVVLVGVNHRINVFGYTYLGDLDARYAVGNVGQLDLVAALEWVRDNIAQFGGDPDNVTIFGESGGGAKISTLMAMPAAKGLFHKAIVESGSMLRVSSREQATQAASSLLAALGLTTDQVGELQKVSAAELFAAASKSSSSPGGIMRLGPVVDGTTLPQQTWESGAPELSAGIPMLIGNCKDEMTLFMLADESLYSLDESGLRTRLVDAGIPESDVEPLLALYRRDHPDDNPSDLYFRIATDRGARWNAARQAELQTERGEADVYVYYFDWDTPSGDGRLRAWHTAELPLAMRLVLYPEAEQLSRQISGAWAAFARTGSPSHSKLPDWPAYTPDRRATMVFDAKQSVAVNDPDGDERRMLRDHPSGNLL